MKKCKACGIPKYPMWYSEEYCSRSCALQKATQIRREYIKILELLRSKK